MGIKYKLDIDATKINKRRNIVKVNRKFRSQSLKIIKLH